MPTNETLTAWLGLLDKIIADLDATETTERTGFAPWGEIYELYNGILAYTEDK